MLFNKNKLFCDISPTCYKISLQKEIVLRHIKNFKSRDVIAKKKEIALLENIVSSHSSYLIKNAPGIDLTLQYNKVTNIDISCRKLNGLIINPGETFSFWQTVGKITKKKGYKNGRVLVRGKLMPGPGGGLCNLVNTIHILIINSPMTVTEFHSHSDALAPDKNRIHIPFSSGTSVSYNNIDYCFKNNTEQPVQLVIYVKDDNLFAELRSNKEYPYKYEIFEEDNHFAKEGEKYYHNSKIYRNVIDKKSGDIIAKELLLDNHSEVMYDYSLIPKEAILKQ